MTFPKINKVYEFWVASYCYQTSANIPIIFHTPKSNSQNECFKLLDEMDFSECGANIVTYCYLNRAFEDIGIQMTH